MDKAKNNKYIGLQVNDFFIGYVYKIKMQRFVNPQHQLDANLYS